MGRRCAGHRRDQWPVAGSVMNWQHQSLLSLVLGVALIIAAIGLWRNQLNDDTGSDDPLPLPLIATTNCDSAQTACVARGEGLAVELSLGSVQPMQPFSIQLRILQGQLSAAAEVELQFQMQNMDMGQNRYRLVVDKQGMWHGNAVLPVCSRGRSDWIAQLAIQEGEQRWSAALPFTAIAQ